MITNSVNIYEFLPVEQDAYCWDPIEYDHPVGSIEDEVALMDIGTILDSAEELCDNWLLPKSIHDGEPPSGMEVGDDRVDKDRSAYRLAIGMVSQELVLGMATSWEDSAISSRMWNLCEITAGIPADLAETFDYCRKVGNFDLLGFIDAPPLRIILDVSKGDGSHSSTASGKAAMLGNRMRTPRSEFLRVLHLASFMQDGMLRTSMSSDPKYLPRIMGGSGVRALFDEPDNLHLYAHAYKAGRCNRVYGSATRELYECLKQLDAGLSTVPVLCRMLGDKQEYLHGTYAEKIFVPTTRFKDRVMERLPEPLIESPGGANQFNSALNRLLRTKHLVTRSSALREWEYSKTIRARLLCRIDTRRWEQEDLAKRKDLRAKFGLALNANTAFAHLIERKANWSDVERLVGSKDHITLTSGATAFEYHDAKWLSSGAKYGHFTIEDLTITEDLFSRDDVSEEQTFKVGGLRLLPIVGNILKPTTTTTRVGLYQINSSMADWAEDLHNRIRLHFSGTHPVPKDVILTEIMKDPEWVNDDTSIVEMCLHDTKGLSQKTAVVVLVSADKRLANRIANTCNIQVERIDPIVFIKAMWTAGLDPYKDRELAHTVLDGNINRRGRTDPVRKYYIDTGSVAHYLTNLDEEVSEGKPTLYRRTYLESGYDRDGHRWTRYQLVEVPEQVAHLQSQLYKPTFRERKFPHRISRGNSSGSGSLSGRPSPVLTREWRTRM